MRISFDLDDTLICHRDDVPREPNRVPWILRYWFREPLRKGAVELLAGLQQQGHEIWVYTTSYRSSPYIRWFLRFHGIRITRVVNQTIHENHCGRNGGPTKAPHLFGIDVHIDDLEGVAIEGRQYGFQVIQVDWNDPQWVGKVLAGITAANGGVIKDA